MAWSGSTSRAELSSVAVMWLIRKARISLDVERLRGADQMNEPVENQKDRERVFHECMASLTASRVEGVSQASEIMNWLLSLDSNQEPSG